MTRIIDSGGPRVAGFPSIRPVSLHPGDKVAILSPSSAVNEEYVLGAAGFLRKRGYEPEIMPFAIGKVRGSYAASLEDRAEDFRNALTDPSIRAILCARGGYGAVHLLPLVPPSLVAANPKWLVGFSDISALHALWRRAGVMSLHAPMAKHLTLEGQDHKATCSLFNILEGGISVEYDVSPHSFNRPGEAEGLLLGGNLAVLNGLAATPFDLLSGEDAKGMILFIEDISEAIYAVERMLMRLWLSGALAKYAAIVVGRFTEYHPDRNHSSMEEMIDRFLTNAGVDIPVAFGFPAGHVADNMPLVEGAPAKLIVGPDRVILKQML